MSRNLFARLTNKPHRPGLEAVLFGLLIVVYLTPIWVFPYFLTCDGPAHVDNAAALRNYLQGGSRVFSEYFTLNLRFVPNWFTNVILAGVMDLVSPLAADKVLMSVVFIPLAMRYAIQVISPQAAILALLAFPALYNDIFHFGFYNFLFGIGLFFVTVGYWLRNGTDLRPQKVLTLTCLALLVYFSHVIAFVELCITLPLLALSLSIGSLDKKERSKTLVKRILLVVQNRIWIPILIALEPGVLMLGSFVLQQHESTPTWPPYDSSFFAWPLYGLTAITNTPARLIMSAVVMLFFTALTVYSIRRTVSAATRHCCPSAFPPKVVVWITKTMAVVNCESLRLVTFPGTSPRSGNW